MKHETVIDGITVGGQPDAADFASGRFQTVINVRGDQEAGNATAQLLAGSNVAYTSVPWTIDTVTPQDIARIRVAVEAASGPVLIHCTAAARAAVAAAIISAERDGSAKAGAQRKMSEAGFVIEGTPYADFIEHYFREMKL